MRAQWSEDIGRVARQRRLDLNMSQDELAERVGVTRQWLSRFESAKSEVSLSKALLVLRELELNIDVTPEATTAKSAMATFAADAMTRKVSTINDELLDGMVGNIRRAMSRSSMSETAVTALGALEEDPRYQRAIDSLAKSMTTPVSEIPSAVSDSENPT